MMSLFLCSLWLSRSRLLSWRISFADCRPVRYLTSWMIDRSSSGAVNTNSTFGEGDHNTHEGDYVVGDVFMKHFSVFKTILGLNSETMPDNDWHHLLQARKRNQNTGPASRRHADLILNWSETQMRLTLRQMSSWEMSLKMNKKKSRKSRSFYFYILFI